MSLTFLSWATFTIWFNAFPSARSRTNDLEYEKKKKGSIRVQILYTTGSLKAYVVTTVLLIPARIETYSHTYRCFLAFLWWAPHLSKEIVSWALILWVILQHPRGNLHYMENCTEKTFVSFLKRYLEEYGYWCSCKSWPWLLLLLFISSLLLPLALFLSTEVQDESQHTASMMSSLWTTAMESLSQ